MYVGMRGLPHFYREAVQHFFLIVIGARYVCHNKKNGTLQVTAVNIFMKNGTSHHSSFAILLLRELQHKAGRECTCVINSGKLKSEL